MSLVAATLLFALRALIQQMSSDNPLRGAPRIHCELLKLGFEVAQSIVAKYMVKRRGPPGQGWLTFYAIMLPILSPWTSSSSRRSASTSSKVMKGFTHTQPSLVGTWISKWR